MSPARYMTPPPTDASPVRYMAPPPTDASPSRYAAVLPTDASPSRYMALLSTDASPARYMAPPATDASSSTPSRNHPVGHVSARLIRASTEDSSEQIQSDVQAVYDHLFAAVDLAAGVRAKMEILEGSVGTLLGSSVAKQCRSQVGQTLVFFLSACAMFAFTLGAIMAYLLSRLLA